VWIYSGKYAYNNPPPAEIKKRGTTALFYNVGITGFCEDNHHQVFVTISESVEVSFFGKRLAGVVKSWIHSVCVEATGWSPKTNSSQMFHRPNRVRFNTIR